MKYVTAQSNDIVCETSESTKAAIQRINSGNYIEQTFRERVEFIHKCRPNKVTECMLEFIRSRESGMGTVSIVATLDPKLFAVDVEYQESEKFWLSRLDVAEVSAYINHLMVLSSPEYVGMQPLSKIFHNRPLKDFRSNYLGYGQDLRKFWSFSLRYDPTFLKRLKDDPDAVPNSIACLYKPRLKSRPYVTLYNIGRHDQIYTYSTQDYRIMHDWSVDENGKIVPDANTKFLRNI